MARVIIGPDIQSQLCPFLYEGTLAPIVDRVLEIPEADETGHVIASIRTPMALSVLALTCKTFHVELQKHRNLQLRALAQQFLDVSPKHGLELVNVVSVAACMRFHIHTPKHAYLNPVSAVFHRTTMTRAASRMPRPNPFCSGGCSSVAVFMSRFV